MKAGQLVYDGPSEVLFSSDQLEQWNLQEPDLITITKELEKKYTLSLRPFPKDVDALFESIKDVIE
jgi:hypothetical protein